MVRCIGQGGGYLTVVLQLPESGRINVEPLSRLGRQDDAVTALRRAAELAPRWSEPHRRMASIHYLRSRYPDAIAEAELAQRLGDQDVQLRVLLREAGLRSP